ncbi:MAG TPA: sulfatase/phosphatase domain-containing protein, partial [Solirubrobacterales bacterium]
KPRFIREAPYLSPTEIHTYRVYYQKMLESLRAVDDGVKQIVDTLGYTGRLRNTYIVFVSDNGFFFGEHRLTGGKFLAYEPATHLPLLIRGPGIKPGTTSGEFAMNVDIAPTILELAGAIPDKSIDGRSLVPFMRDTTLRTRRPLLFESFVETSDVEQQGGAAARTSARGGAQASILAPPKDYEGIRLGPYKYIAWPTGEKELYDINRDPYELNNIARDPNFFPVRNALHNELINRLEDCVGRVCREAAADVPLTRKEIQRARAEERQEKRQKQREKRQKEKEAKQKP